MIIEKENLFQARYLSADPSGATIGPGKTFSRGPQTYPWRTSGEKIL